jgi:hypothetical protein
VRRTQQPRYLHPFHQNQHLLDTPLLVVVKSDCRVIVPRQRTLQGVQRPDRSGNVLCCSGCQRCTPHTSSDEAVTECSLIVLIGICELTPANVYQTALRLRSRTFNGTVNRRWIIRRVAGSR